MPPADPGYTLRSRTAAISGFVCVCLILLVARVVVLLGPDSHTLAQRASAQRSVSLPLRLPRGDIVDRTGRPLTGNTTELNVAVFPTLVDVSDRPTVAVQLSRLLGVQVAGIARALGGSEPAVVARRVRTSVAASVRRLGLAGVVAVEQSVRYGPNPTAVHLVGYVRQADGKGMSGIEAEEDAVLAEPGASSLSAEVDGRHQLIHGLGLRLRDPQGRAKATSASQVQLTIDLDLQARLEQAMATVAKGAAVALDVKTGQILAMVSRPAFDPSDVATSLTDPARPLIDRAICGFTPGSVFKLVTATAALESGRIAPSKVFWCPGYVQVAPSMRVSCAEVQGHGHITLMDALSQSCNVTYVEAALSLGPELVLATARRLGFGAPTGVDLPDEEAGALPTPSHMTKGDTANMALGQKDILVTPLQAARLMAAIANDGLAFTPTAILSSVDASGHSVRQPSRLGATQVMSESTARYLRAALERAVDSGTGTQASGVWGGAAGKTGTAQTDRRDAAGNRLSQAWFVGYAPRDNPRVAVAVLAEDGGSGGTVAVPIFRAFLSYLGPESAKAGG